MLTAESEVIGSEAAWLRYELAHRRAVGLAQSGQPVEALRAAQEAVSNWAFVRSAFIRPDGTAMPSRPPVTGGNGDDITITGRDSNDTFDAIIRDHLDLDYTIDVIHHNEHVKQQRAAAAATAVRGASG